MKKRLLLIMCLIALLLAAPLLAEEELITKLFFDNWLRSATTPVEGQISMLKESLSQLEKQARALRSQVGTEIKVVIGQKRALKDGSPVALDVAPLINKGRTMVPVRFIGEAFGASFAWDGEARKVTYTLEGVNIELYIGKKRALVNGNPVILDVEPVIVSGRTMVPLRFVGEYMDASFEWDGQTQTVTIFG